MRKLLAAAVVVAVLAFGCGDDDENEETAGGPPVQLTGDLNDEGRADISGDDEAELAVEADDFYFDPTFIRSEPGGTVTVTITNEGDAPHTFTIDSLDIDEQVEPGDDVEVEVELPDEGALAFYCRFHQGQGMQGAFYDEAGAQVTGAQTGGTSSSSTSSSSTSSPSTSSPSTSATTAPDTGTTGSTGTTDTSIEDDDNSGSGSSGDPY